MTASGSRIAEIAGRHMRYHDRTMLERCTAYAEPFTVALALNWARRIAEVTLA